MDCSLWEIRRVYRQLKYRQTVLFPLTKGFRGDIYFWWGWGAGQDRESFKIITILMGLENWTGF